jgi:hypothetical protein
VKSVALHPSRLAFSANTTSQKSVPQYIFYAKLTILGTV